VYVFRNKKEIEKYSCCVDLDEIKTEDFNLNIRGYVDNSPEPEIEDVKAHINGGVPKREVGLDKETFEKFGISQDDIFKEKNESYFRFKSGIQERDKIKAIIETHEKVQDIEHKMEEALETWWNKAKSEIEGFLEHNNVARFRLETG